MGILKKDNITQVIRNSNFEIGAVPSGVFMNFFNYTSTPDYIHTIDDNMDWINFSYKILDYTYNSILIAGLGLGAVPQYLAENFNITTIDVVEKNPDLISTMTGFNLYDSRINIIEGDIFTYTPNTTYDRILFDIWCPAFLESNFNVVVESLRTLYNSYLNINGFMYFPILEVFGEQDTFSKI